MDISPDRSVLMIIKGTMQHSRISHKGLFHMVHPQFWDPSLRDQLRTPNGWMLSLQSMTKPEVHRKHLGQPLSLPNGHVALPASGWLTNTLDAWPIAPKDIRHAGFMARDVGSRVSTPPSDGDLLVCCWSSLRYLLWFVLQRRRRSNRFLKLFLHNLNQHCLCALQTTICSWKSCGVRSVTLQSAQKAVVFVGIREQKK